ncbi:hypothetical protein Syun_015810 [Stephania yunnanensis]|uniref:Calmodulin-lysine N-methyltransferase n=1 Tax=Stephania yunnanensis TaxID=152371 RepID=A0AAP0PDC4_9MAGN
MEVALSKIKKEKFINIMRTAARYPIRKTAIQVNSEFQQTMVTERLIEIIGMKLLHTLQRLLDQEMTPNLQMLSRCTSSTSSYNINISLCIPSKSESKRPGRLRKVKTVRWELPMHPTTPSTLLLRQRVENHIDFDDFHVSHKFHIDNTGLVCHWPSEDVLAYFCLSRADMFRSKRILELGAGYGFAGLAIAAGTEALEVVISDGNPKVVDCILCVSQRELFYFNILVVSLILHWNEELDSNTSNNTFDIIVASDCTFFKEFHEGLANIIKSLLKPSAASQAIFFSPRRGDSLDKFLEKVKEAGLHFTIADNYDEVIWERHQKFLLVDTGMWKNVQMLSCIVCLLSTTHQPT